MCARSAGPGLLPFCCRVRPWMQITEAPAASIILAYATDLSTSGKILWFVDTSHAHVWREGERETDRQTDSQRDRETERQRDRDRETERQGQRDRETERQRNRQAQRQSERTVCI